MTRFNDEEFLLIENLINKIAKEDKNSKKKLNFSNKHENGSREEDYITERIEWHILFKGEIFRFYFNKHLIDANPRKEEETSFGNRVNKLFNADVFRIEFDSHTHGLRRGFQILPKLRNGKYTFNSTMDELKVYDKEPFVKGISIRIYSEGGDPLNFYNNNYDENIVIYIQTNNIKEANKNMKNLFYKLIIKAINKACVDIKKIKKKKK